MKKQLDSDLIMLFVIAVIIVFSFALAGIISVDPK